MTALFLESQSSSNSTEDFLIIGGLIQLIVGFVQLLGALIRTIYGLITKQSLTHLRFYWLMVGIYFIVLYFISKFDGHFLMFWIAIAWFIALYYWIAIVFKKNKYIFK